MPVPPPSCVPRPDPRLRRSRETATSIRRPAQYSSPLPISASLEAPCALTASRAPETANDEQEHHRGPDEGGKKLRWWERIQKTLERKGPEDDL